MSKTTTTDMRLVPIDKLVPYVNNARTHSADQIMKLRSSLLEFGFIKPVIIDRDYGVIAGHGRLLAAKEEGFSEVPLCAGGSSHRGKKRPKSWRTTAMHRMHAGMKRCYGLRSKPCRGLVRLEP